jgi:predicted N-acyltransferase
VTSDITERIGELYPLYSQVFARAKWRFEKLTPQFFCELGRRMPGKVRYFVWTKEGRAVAFSLCMVSGEDIFAEYSTMPAPSTTICTTTPCATS